MMKYIASKIISESDLRVVLKFFSMGGNYDEQHCQDVTSSLFLGHAPFSTRAYNQ